MESVRLPRMKWRNYASLFFLSAALLAACAAPPSVSDSSFVVADLFATPGKSLATIEPAPTVAPSPTVYSIAPPTIAPTLALPTVVILQSAQPQNGGLLLTPSVTSADPTLIPATPACPAEPPLPFAAIWQNAPQARASLGCPAGSPDTVSGIWQGFERGVMFRRDSDQSILIISNAAIQQGKTIDAWWRLPDMWQDGDPESDSALIAPDGLIQPLRGFGKLWRANGFIRQALGWATGDATPIDSQWMRFEGGWMMAGPNESPLYVMIGADAQTVGTHLAPTQ